MCHPVRTRGRDNRDNPPKKNEPAKETGKTIDVRVFTCIYVYLRVFTCIYVYLGLLVSTNTLEPVNISMAARGRKGGS